MSVPCHPGCFIEIDQAQRVKKWIDVPPSAQSGRQDRLCLERQCSS
jgi:hypothetical protein